MRVKCVNGFIGCITENNYYEIIAVYNQYIAVIEDNGRIGWSFIANFEEFNHSLIENKIKFPINWEIL